MDITTTSAPRRSVFRTILIALIPVVLLAGVILLFLATDGAGLQVKPAAPIERVQITRTILQPGRIQLEVQNTSPQAITISQMVINDAFWPFTVTPGQTLDRLQTASIVVTYPWVEGEAYEIMLLSSNGVKFAHLIEVAASTHTASSTTLLSFTLIGLYVGVIPIFLGMVWFPVLKRMGARWMMLAMAITLGLLIYLGVDATNESLEQAALLASPFQGVGLVVIGIVATFLLLLMISRQQAGIGRSESSQRMGLALMIAVGIGLHNLGEGLAIGAAFTAGVAALGTFLVIGFILQNITEGLGIVAPVLRDRPALSFLALTGLIGGAPAIAGAWIGGLVTAPALNVLFLAIGAGAVFEVVFEVGKLLRKDMAKGENPLWIFAGVLIGMLMLYVTGLWIK